MSHTHPVLTGVVGLGGYAQSVLHMLESALHGPEPHGKLTAMYAPDEEKFPEVVTKLKDKGVRFCRSYAELLAQPIEAVWLPLPIDLHRPFTEQALAAGKAVLCEKPIAGSVDDAEAMIAARDRAKKPAFIGYQDTYHPTTLPLKRRLLSGELGKIDYVSVLACWPRDSAYFGRSTWAGRIRRDGNWVMDSPANNAMAHYISLPLFLVGPDETHSATPVHVDAELYRSKPIENFDTIGLRAKLDTGVTFMVMMTHSCEAPVGPQIDIHTDQALVEVRPDAITIRRGSTVDTSPRLQDIRWQMAHRFAQAVRGIPNHDISVATLEVARAQLIAVNGASEATEVVGIDEQYVKEKATERGTLRYIPGIADMFRRCVAERKLPHEARVAPWTRAGGAKDLRGYRHFAGPKGYQVPTMAS